MTKKNPEPVSELLPFSFFTLHGYLTRFFMFTTETQKLMARNSVSGITLPGLGCPSGATDITFHTASFQKSSLMVQGSSNTFGMQALGKLAWGDFETRQCSSTTTRPN